MRYHVSVGTRTIEVDLSGDRITVAGEACDAELRAVAGSSLRHLLVDGRGHTLFARPGETRGTWHIRVNGQGHEVEVVDERTRAIREMTGSSGGPRGPRPVRAPMPGLVVRVEVEPGDQVAAGQGVIIVEAMKMENELKADAGGVVRRIHVEAGQAVEKGTVLIEFEAADT